jgi:hypothetical protein
MTCYMRHMGWLFEALELPDDKPERRRVDTAIREALALADDAHCPQVWAAIKALDDVGRADLTTRVGESVAR